MGDELTPSSFFLHLWPTRSLVRVHLLLSNYICTDAIYCSPPFFLKLSQATEKALIAWQYMDDAKKVRRSENLASLAQSLPSELRQVAIDLDILTQGVKKMKYPDGTHIPSKAYTRDQASRAVGLANKIIQNVDEYLR